MALSKEDLCAISQIMDERLEVQLDKRLEGINTEIKGIKAEIKGIKTEIKGMKADIAKLQSDVFSIKLKQENVFEPQLKLLAENYIPAAKRYMETSAQIEQMQEDIIILKKVTTHHSEILSKIS